MQRLKKIKKHVDWLQPLHDIAMQQTGLTDFGDPAYLAGLKVLLETYDLGCHLNGVGEYGAQLKLIHVLTRRLLAEQSFKDNPLILQNQIRAPLLITGIVRTGSTALHYLMAKDPNRQTLPYWLAERPQPRPAESAWPEHPDFLASKNALDMMYDMAPELKAIHYMAADWPEECGHLMAHTFTDDYWPCGMPAPHYNEWYEHANLVPTYQHHKKLLQLIGSNQPDKPWLLKYPVHMKHLKSFLAVYPDAKIIWTHRDPSRIMSSYASLIANFRKLNADNVDYQYAAQEQLEIWAAGADRAIEVRKEVPSDQFYDLYFDDFVTDAVGSVKKIYQHFGIEWTSACDTALTDWHTKNPQNKHGKHEHSDVDMGLSRQQIIDRFANYIDYFNIEVN